jgi:predicted peptidase
MKMRSVRAFALVAVIVSCARAAPAQETGFLNRSVAVDGDEYRYQIYVPREFKPSTPMPIILALHGGGAANARDGLRQTENGLARAIRLHVERFPSIVVFPQSPAGTSWVHPLGERIALAALDKSINEFRSDTSRVYVVGHSAGGNGSWSLAYRHPDRFAALIVVCGYIGESIGGRSGIHYPAILPPTVKDPYAAIAQRVSRLPIWIFHGDADPIISVEESRRMASALKAIAGDVQYTELPGVGHNAQDPAYDREDLFVWLFRQKRR